MKITQRKMIQLVLTVSYLSLPVSQGQGKLLIPIMFSVFSVDPQPSVCPLSLVPCIVPAAAVLCDDDVMMSGTPSCHHKHNHGGKWGDHDGVVS